MNQMEEWYKLEDGKAVIELRAPLLRNLFDERDPAPFRDRDLDDDAVEYIVSAAQDIHPKKLGKLRIIVNDPQLEERRALAIDAIHDYFEYHVDLTKRKRRNTFDIGIRSLLIGLVILVCIDHCFKNRIRKRRRCLLEAPFKRGPIINWMGIYVETHKLLPLRMVAD
jgi:hypothetical protein